MDSCSGQLGMDHLDRHPAIERGIGGEKDHAHASAAQLALEPVLGAKGGLECGEEIDGRIAHVRDQGGEIKDTPDLGPAISLWINW